MTLYDQSWKVATLGDSEKLKKQQNIKKKKSKGNTHNIQRHNLYITHRELNRKFLKRHKDFMTFVRMNKNALKK